MAVKIEDELKFLPVIKIPKRISFVCDGGITYKSKEGVTFITSTQEVIDHLLFLKTHLKMRGEQSRLCYLNDRQKEVFGEQACPKQVQRITRHILNKNISKKSVIRTLKKLNCDAAVVWLSGLSDDGQINDFLADEGLGGFILLVRFISKHQNFDISIETVISILRQNYDVEVISELRKIFVDKMCDAIEQGSRKHLTTF